MIHSIHSWLTERQTWSSFIPKAPDKHPTAQTKIKVRGHNFRTILLHLLAVIQDYSAIWPTVVIHKAQVREKANSYCLKTPLVTHCEAIAVDLGETTRKQVKIYQFDFIWVSNEVMFLLFHFKFYCETHRYSFWIQHSLHLSALNPELQGEPEPIPTVMEKECPLLTQQHLHSAVRLIECPVYLIPKLLVFGLWEETGIPKDNPGPPTQNDPQLKLGILIIQYFKK